MFNNKNKITDVLFTNSATTSKRLLIILRFAHGCNKQLLKVLRPPGVRQLSNTVNKELYSPLACFLFICIKSKLAQLFTSKFFLNYLKNKLKITN